MKDSHYNAGAQTSPALTEIARLQELYSLELLDTAPDQGFDELVQLAAAICATPISAMSLLDHQRQWFKSSIGLAIRETPRDIAFCDHAIRQQELFVVEDARKDTRFASNPLVTGESQVQFYAGMPLMTPNGFVLGTLCVIDRQPRQLTDQQRKALQVLARQVMGRIALHAQQRATAAAIAEKDRIAAGLAEYQYQLEQANDKLRNLVVTDDLTGLKNRRAFDERLTFEFAMARRKRRDLSVALLDLDDFKGVNDHFGHPAGDGVLRQFASTLQATVRETDLPARYGGEEFAILLPETDAQEAIRWCARFQQSLAKRRWEHVRVTASIGIATRASGYDSGTEMIAAADHALYRAKARGKDTIVLAEMPGAASLAPCSPTFAGGSSV